MQHPNACKILWSVIVLTFITVPASAGERVISRDELMDKLNGFWIGQLVGNYLGFPFESQYVEEPMPFLVQRYYTYKDADTTNVHRNDRRGFIPIFAEDLGGAWTDDDTDIEFVTLHAVEQYGLDITYPEIADEWKQHINRKIWIANREARNLMDKGLIPPETGKKENNSGWYAIDPQLVNEIWSAFYPGMTRLAAGRAEWGARITSDEWGTHPTIAYAVMYSAAFFESDVNKLVDIAYTTLPKASPFADGVADLILWHKENPDWRKTRRLLHEKYFDCRKVAGQAPADGWSSLINGLSGVMAILYGEGDFLKTVGIAVSAGYDCDNQSATCAGLIGVMHGLGCIPEYLTKEIPSRKGPWKEPFNDRYMNTSRDGLPIENRISDIVARIGAIAERAIIDNGGRVFWENGKMYYGIPCDF